MLFVYAYANHIQIVEDLHMICICAVYTIYKSYASLMGFVYNLHMQCVENSIYIQMMCKYHTFAYDLHTYTHSAPDLHMQMVYDVHTICI